MKPDRITLKDLWSGSPFILAGGTILWLLYTLAYVLPSEDAIHIFKAVPYGWFIAGVLMASSLLFISTGVTRLYKKWQAASLLLAAFCRISGGALLIFPAVVFGIAAPWIMDAHPLRQFICVWPVCGFLLLMGIFLLVRGRHELRLFFNATKGALSLATVTTILLVGLTITPFLLAVPAVKSEGLRLDGSPYFVYPEIRSAGERAQVQVDVANLEIEVGSGVSLEQLDSHTIRLTNESSRLSILLSPEEAIYGLTERVVDSAWDSEIWPKEIGGLDLRGQVIHMWVNPSFAIYSPFYLSTNGYGMLVEGTWPGLYDIGNTHPDQLNIDWEHDPEGGFSCVFFFGPALTDVLDRYTAFTGRPVLPPEWAFKHLRWRGEFRAGNFAELDGAMMNADLVEDITMYEKLGIPPGIVILDRPWAEGEYGYGNFNWDPDRFPNPEQMLDALHDRGWHAIVWGAPWALDEFREEAKALGYFVPGCDRCIDYTNPLAMAWHRDKIVDFMLQWETDGWRLDRAEEFTPSGRNDAWFDGRSGFELHNDYTSLTIQVFHEASQQVRGDDFILVSRFSYGRDKAWTIVWGGDAPGSVLFGNGSGTDLGLGNSIISLLRSSTMGYPVWGSNAGGYYPFTDRELFARWLEFAALSPLMDIGGVGSHEPWAMPTEPAYDEELIAIYRKYVLLHHSLGDYLYDLAVLAHKTGHPIAYPLVFDHPDDPQVYDLWDQYMLGPKYLVAPIWRLGQYRREVYLPEGQWMDYWDENRSWEGPITINYDAPLDVIPLFVRSEE